MKKIRFPVFLLLGCLLLTALAPGAAALSDPPVECSYCLLLETNTNTVLYERGADERAYPASLTKMMTVLLAIEAIENRSTTSSGVTVTADVPVTAQPGFDFDLIEDGTSAYIQAYETMPLEDLLYCAMLSSGNDACNVIATFMAGTPEGYVVMMNQRAAELGCTGTHFANTHGLPNDNHYTTARDLSIIAREAVSHSLFREICGTRTCTLPATNLSAARELSNTNALINPNDHYPGDYIYDGCSGIKTGFTASAGYCLASLAAREGVSNIQLLSIVLHSPAYDDDGNGVLDRYCNFTDAAALFDYGFDNFSYREVLKSTEIVTEVPVSMADNTDTVAVRPSTSIVRLLANDDDLSGYQKIPTIYAQQNGEKLEAPISAGQVLGEISVLRNGEVIGTASLVASTDVNLSRTRYMRTEIMETLRRPVVRITFWVLFLLFALYLTLVIRYRMRRKRYSSKEYQTRVARAIASGDDEAEDWYNDKPVRARVRTVPRTAPPPAPKRPARPASARDRSSATHAIPDDESFRDYFEEFFGGDDNGDDDSDVKKI